MIRLRGQHRNCASLLNNFAYETSLGSILFLVCLLSTIDWRLFGEKEQNPHAIVAARSTMLVMRIRNIN